MRRCELGRGAQPGLAVVRPRLLRAAIQPARSDQRRATWRSSASRGSSKRRPARPRSDAARGRRRDVCDRIVERHLRDRRAHRQAALEVRPRGASQVRQHRLLRRRQSRRARSTRAASTSACSMAGSPRSMPRAARSRGRRRRSIRQQPYTITGAPRIAKGKIIIGNGGAEYGVRGYVSAYDAETGKLAWRFYTVPGDPSKPQENKALERACRRGRATTGGSTAAAARCGTRSSTTPS